MTPVEQRFSVFDISESSSVGRAQPCQGWGRGFESRLPLIFLPSLIKDKCSSGGIGRHAGLKILCSLGRAGSSPASSTFKKKALYHSDTGLFWFDTCRNRFDNQSISRVPIQPFHKSWQPTFLQFPCHVHVDLVISLANLLLYIPCLCIGHYAD